MLGLFPAARSRPDATHRTFRLEQLATDHASAPVGNKEIALFRFADKLTRKASEIEKADADAVFRYSR